MPEMTDCIQPYMDRPTGYIEKIELSRNQLGMGLEGCCYMLRVVLLLMQQSWDMSNETFKESIWCEIQLNRTKMFVEIYYQVLDATEAADKGKCKLQEMANKETSLIT